MDRMNEARACPHCGSVKYSLLRNGLIECAKCGKQDWLVWKEEDEAKRILSKG